GLVEWWVLVEVQPDRLSVAVRVAQAEVGVDLHGEAAEDAEGVAGLCELDVSARLAARLAQRRDVAQRAGDERLVERAPARLDLVDDGAQVGAAGVELDVGLERLDE